MIYGYIRVSTDRQTVENQRFEIKNWCAKAAERNPDLNLKVSSWIEETVSGTKAPDKRKLGQLLGKLRAGDILICAELSRLGRNLLMIMSILNYCMENDIQVWTIKENYRLGDNVNSKVLAFAFGLSAEIERTLISQRTKEALARKRAEGVILGRPLGRRSSKTVLSGKDDLIRSCLEAGFSKSAIARKLKVHRITLDKYVQLHIPEFSRPGGKERYEESEARQRVRCRERFQKAKAEKEAKAAKNRQLALL